MAVEKQLEQLLKEIQRKSDTVRYTLKALSNDDKRTNRVARLTKELEALWRLMSYWRNQAHNIDRSIKDNIPAALVSANEDVRKRGQQHHKRQKRKK